MTEFRAYNRPRTMVFVLDNYDSFTYNLVQYMGELGAEMVVKRNDELTPEEVEALKPERILISPGPCTPQDAGISAEREDGAEPRDSGGYGRQRRTLGRR